MCINRGKNSPDSSEHEKAPAGIADAHWCGIFNYVISWLPINQKDLV
jgi:hypothetical protein